jgi:hypothetical protein
MVLEGAAKSFNLVDLNYGINAKTGAKQHRPMSGIMFFFANEPSGVSMCVQGISHIN